MLATLPQLPDAKKAGTQFTMVGWPNGRLGKLLFEALSPLAHRLGSVTIKNLDD